MKILTLNTWQERGPWKDRWKLICAGLSRFRPEIVFFQEAFNAEWAAKIRVQAGYRYMVFPKEPSGLMILSQYPVSSWESLTYQAKSHTEDYFRYALHSKVFVRGREIALFNTHLSWRTPESKIRQAQVCELLSFMEKKALRLPIFAAGDFNASPETPELQLMNRVGRFIDIWKMRNPGRGGLTWDNRNPFAAGSSVRMLDRRIDFVWMRDPQKIFKARYVNVVYDKAHGGIYASDHFGVLAELEMSEPREVSNHG